MLDNKRKALEKGQILPLDENKTYTIIEEIGRGASCIVYSASYLDAGKYLHYVRIKECYPYYLEIIRADDGSLEIPESLQNAFSQEQEKFNAAYEKNVSLKSRLELINSTVDPIYLFFYNNTSYSVMTCVEGMDYRIDADENLQSLFIRILTLAKIIKKFHDCGVLYLDIKPANIFLIPETKELIKLFDFDSLVLKDDLKSGKEIRFSYSDGYAAPELVKGNKNKISEATDIYSIGAVLFYKLFGRTPTALDSSLGSVYDFTLIKYKDERYQPDLFHELNTFLHKTVSSSIVCRYKNMDQVISSLNQLIPLSDIERTFLFYDFSYNSACFFGREAEISQIVDNFDSGQQVLFLSGIGGIGKTELAKRYAYENSEQYRKIIFLPFSGSIKETVCGNYLHINKIEQGNEEEDDDYFFRKLAVLKSVSSSNDLIILDNFDVEYDEYLEQLFECPCKFLVTTREDFRDFGYKQLDVDRIEDIDELLKIFKVYHPYPQNEDEEIRDLIEMVDRHTMTVELIAKYLRTTNGNLQVLMNMLMKKEGITSTEEIRVKHRKDRKLRAESINSHLLVLFNLSGFTEGQRELIRSLSLLGYVRIAKEKFLSYCPVNNNQKELAALIRQGWIEYDSSSGKVSLHQIILDLVYNHLKPDAENCPNILSAMTGYLIQPLPNRVEKTIRRKLMKDFMQRIKGENLAYARLCVYYCQNIRKTARYLDEAEQICLIQPENEVYDLLQKICRMKIKLAGEENIMEKMINEEDFDENEYFAGISSSICQLADKAYEYARKFSSSPEYLGRFCVELAREIDEASAANPWMIDFEENHESMNWMLDKAVVFIGKAEDYLLKAEMDSSEKIKLLRKMQDFFSSDDFSSLYRSDHYHDAERKYHYQKIIENIRDKDDDVIDLQDFLISDFAEEAKIRGDYQNAIELYNKAYQEGDGLASYYQSEIAHLYLDMGEKEKAVGCFKQILEEDHTFEWHTHYTCCELINLLTEESQIDEARKYSEKLIHSAYKHIDDDKDYLQWMVIGYYQLYKLEDSGKKKSEYWNNSVTYYSQISEEKKFISEFTEFLLDFANHQETDEEKIAFSFTCLEHMDFGYRSEDFRYFLDDILNLCQNKPEFLQAQIRALLEYSQYLMDADSNQKEEIFSFYTKADKLYTENKIEDPYLYSLLHHTLAQYYDKFENDEYDRYKQIKEEKNKCDYLLLAEHKAAGQSRKKQIEIWKNAADEYDYLDNFTRQKECYDRLFAVFSPEINAQDGGDFEQYWRFAMSQVRCYGKLQEVELAKERIGFLCEKAFYYLEDDGEKEEHERAENLSQKLSDCAEQLLEIRWESAAFVLYMISLILSIRKEVDQEYIRQFFHKSPDSQSWQVIAENEDEKEILLSVFSLVLHGKIKSQDVDDIIYKYEQVKPILEKTGEFKKFADELEWFSSVYQNKEIEFKR